MTPITEDCLASAKIQVEYKRNVKSKLLKSKYGCILELNDDAFTK